MRALTSVFKELNNFTAVIQLDHNMKVFPRKYQEAQSEFFEKKGMSLLGMMVSYTASRN